MTEKVRCNLCNGNRWVTKLVAHDEFWVKSEEFQIVQCSDCGLSFVNPRPSREEISKYYPDEYYVDSEEWCIERSNIKELQSRVDHVLEYYEAQNPGKLLDIGIFNGAFVSYVLKSGWDAYGLDPDENAIALAKKIVPPERLFHGYIESFPLLPRNIDVITMWEVLEHTMNPLDVLKKVYNILSRSGMIVISAPNFHSIERYCFGNCWNGLDVPRHLYHFAPDTLRKALEKTGFRKVWIKTTNACEILEFCDPITYGQESLRNFLIHCGLYPERTGIVSQGQNRISRREKKIFSHQNWKRFLFKIIEIPFLNFINLIGAACNSRNTIIAIGKKF